MTEPGSRAIRSRGFTLIELLVVIGIIALLIGLLVPVVQRVRQSGSQAQVMNQLKQCSLAANTCDGQNNCLPPAAGPFGAQVNEHSLFVHLLPFIEQQAIFDQAINDPDGTKTNWSYNVIEMYWAKIDPSQGNGIAVGGYPAGNIAANYQVFGDPLHNSMTGQTSITQIGGLDGTSNTIMFATKYGICGPDDPGLGVPLGSGWPLTNFPPNSTITAGAFFAYETPTISGYIPTATGVGVTFQVAPKPINTACDPNYAQAFTTSGLQVALCDGSVHTVSPTIGGQTWRNALLIADGIALGSDW